MFEILEKVNGFVWGAPALILIVAVGLYLTVCTGFAQFTLFPQAVKQFWTKLRGRKETKNGTSPYRALCTALAATVGTGNLAGVAGAIAIGGPGAVFWMWICALLGMITKYAEATLAVRYRTKNKNGEYVGGPMYLINKGLGQKWNWLANIFCFFGVIASFGVGNATQVNAVVGGINSALSFFGLKETASGDWTIGIMLAILVGFMLLGGSSRIGSIAERLVPFASLLYILLATGVLCVRFDMIGKAFESIVYGAFSPQAVTGGVLGSSFQVLRVGASRGVFTNEAGMGTAAIAHAAADVEQPSEQGLMGIMEVFLDTVVICTLTALVILCSGVCVPYGTDVGVMLTTDAFSQIYGNWITIPISVALCCFALATILGWGLYGARCAQYLFGEKVWKPYALMQALVVIVGAVMNTGTVWLISETVNGLMVIPNLLALAWLSPELVKLTVQYQKCTDKSKKL